MTVLNSRYFLWALLALPSVGFAAALISGASGPDGEPASEFLLHPTGEFAARFMILAMTLTPLRMLFPASDLLRWLMKRRRSFGVAAFGYATLHTLLYLIDMASLRAVMGEAFALGIWTGWLAFFVFIPLAVTSNDWSVRALGPTWRRLQQTVYVAAVATLLHWIFVHNNFGPALVHFLPLVGLEGYRIWKNAARARPSTI
ncbi:MAG: ferric reductase-like transmembrane domain-containing protein [Pseudomonadota bacterium]